MKTFFTIAILGMSLNLMARTVKGYVKKDGTYVAPHIRSAPDKSVYNNYGYRPGDEIKDKKPNKKGW